MKRIEFAPGNIVDLLEKYHKVSRVETLYHTYLTFPHKPPRNFKEG